MHLVIFSDVTLGLNLLFHTWNFASERFGFVSLCVVVEDMDGIRCGFEFVRCGVLGVVTWQRKE